MQRLNHVARCLGTGQLRSVATSSASGEVVFHEDPSSPVRKVELNRPKALNCLNTTMVREMVPLYKEWNKSSSGLILLRSSGKKAFCAGGDVVAISKYKDVQRDFFFEEYHLDYMISQLKIPHISMLRGIVMGGGVGVSLPGSHRVACDTSTFAMPETAIGFAPDVGASWFLPRLTTFPMGMFLGLTGYRLKGYDLKATGVATHYVPEDQMDIVEDALLSLDPSSLSTAAESHAAVNKLLAEAEGVATFDKVFSLEEHLPTIEECFGKGSVEDIILALEETGGEWCQKMVKTLNRLSPTSLKVVFEEMRRGAEMSDISEAYKLEYDLVQRFMVNHDFHEGVRAVLIEKDNKPEWKPSKLADVRQEDVASYFQRIEGNWEWKPQTD